MKKMTILSGKIFLRQKSTAFYAVKDYKTYLLDARYSFPKFDLTI